MVGTLRQPVDLLRLSKIRAISLRDLLAVNFSSASGGTASSAKYSAAIVSIDGTQQNLPVLENRCPRIDFRRLILDFVAKNILDLRDGNFSFGDEVANSLEALEVEYSHRTEPVESRSMIELYSRIFSP